MFFMIKEQTRTMIKDNVPINQTNEFLLSNCFVDENLENMGLYEDIFPVSFI